MPTVRELIENKEKLNYNELCTALVSQFGVNEKVNFDSILPSPQQQELFGGETLRLIAEHPKFTTQKDIRPISLLKGDTSQLIFFFVSLNDVTLPKSVIQRITTRFIRGSEANRFIIWFFGNKNSTELKVVLSGKEGKKIVLKTLPFGTKQPYYKTYDFILNEVSQKLNRLFVEPTDLWKALWSAFDISIVNRNFYNEIKNTFEKLIEQLKRKGNPFQTDEDRVQFAIRLIGRIIFCWFLKRKGIIKDDAISSASVNKFPDYYHQLLEILFFDVFNSPKPRSTKNIPAEIIDYPFLNGGLFEDQPTDFNSNFQLQISNEWFYNFFNNTLEKYNFTVDENSSTNSEIAIDPEMLGRIFENLLAEQNPETGESARKATGSFYTPREIVDYMVEQSISEYLKNYLNPRVTTETDIEPDISKDLFGIVPNQQLKFSVDKPIKSIISTKQNIEFDNAIEDFVHTQHLPEYLENDIHKKKLIEALNIVKVLDPACGSGAFPIGVLQKIVALKHHLQPKAKPYKIKLDTIQNSIYGVDIQPMAVELSRLRCWLSLVVDEEMDDIKSLPNLDFKFVCADSLIDIPVTKETKILLDEKLKSLEENVSNYFSSDYQNKKKLRSSIKASITGIIKVNNDIINHHIVLANREKNSATETQKKQRTSEIEKYMTLQGKWKSYENIFTNHKVEFFNSNYFFPSAKNGFDILIANPPYIQLSKDERIEESYKTALKENYKTSGGRLNTFIFFIHRGLNLLKENGILTYIIPNTILTQDYYKYTREQILKFNTLDKIVTYFNMPFENAVVENVTLIVKKTVAGEYPIKIYTDDLDKVELISTKSKSNFMSQNNFSFNINTNDIIESVFSKGYKTLKQYCEVNQAIALVGDKSLSLKDSNPKKKYFQLLDGRNINKYLINWDGVYLDYDLDRIHSCKRKDIFESSEKLFFRRVSENLIFTYDNEQYFALNTIIVVNRKPIETIRLKYLLGILNSTLLNYLYKGKFKSTKKVFSEIQARSVEQLPIIEIKNQHSMISLVDQILTSKKQNPQADTSKLENEIDVMVYKLYNLTYGEVSVIDKNFENHMNRKEYDEKNFGFEYTALALADSTTNVSAAPNKKRKGKALSQEDIDLL